MKHKIFKVKMTCNCVGINYCCLIVYVANDTNYTVQRCNYFHHKHLPAELTEDLKSDFVSIREVLLFNLQPLIAADTNSNCYAFKSSNFDAVFHFKKVEIKIRQVNKSLMTNRLYQYKS